MNYADYLAEGLFNSLFVEKPLCMVYRAQLPLV
jgi:hypothetical protein